MRSLQLLFLGLLVSLLLFSCKEEEDEVITPVNKLQAQAGADYEAAVDSIVTLDGSASKDGNNETFTFAWTLKSKPEGSEVTLNDAQTAKPSFTPDLPGAYIITLKITNDSGESTDEVTITAKQETPTATMTIIDGDISSDRVLEDIFTDDPAKIDYLVTADVNVSAKLTVKPGVVIAFEEDKSLKIDQEGKLVAQGTETQLITFTGKEPETGYWKGIAIVSSSTDNEITYAHIKHAGSEAIYPMSKPAAVGVANQAYLKLTFTTIEQASDNGFLVEEGGMTDLSTNMFMNNDSVNIALPVDQAHKMDAGTRVEAKTELLNYVQLVGDQLKLEQEVTWKRLTNGTYYKLVEEVSVLSGLRIQEGTQIRFNPDKFFRIMSDGYLYAKGTNSEPIGFDIHEFAGFNWGGILFKSGSPNNLLEWVNISHAGNGTPGYGMMESAAISVDNETGAKLSMKNTTIAESVTYGLYVEDDAFLGEFSDNRFENNAGIALALPLSEIGKLTATSLTTQGNGTNAVEIVGDLLQLDKETTWTAFSDATTYYVGKDISIRSGLNIMPGAVLEFGPDVVLTVTASYLSAKGTEEKPIIFTGAEKTAGYWRGLVFVSNDAKNELSYCEVSYGGSNDMPGMIATRANIAVDALLPGRLSITHSVISNGAGWGVAVETGWGAVINDDLETANDFSDLASGNVYKY